MARQSSDDGGDNEDADLGAGSTLCMKICDAPLPDQINSLERLVLEMKVTEPGELWYVVSTTFWETWREFARSMDTTCRPTCVNNAALLGEDGALRSDLQELKDYVLVDHRVWRLIVALFGVAPGSEVPRQVIQASVASMHLQIELYPFTFYVGKVDGDMLESLHTLSHIWLSRSLTIQEAVSRICKLLQIAPIREAYTWWRRSANAESFMDIEQWTQVGFDVRLDMLDIADRDEIIVQCISSFPIDSSLSKVERYRTTRPRTDLRIGDLVDAKFGNSNREARVKKVILCVKLRTVRTVK